MVCLSLLFLIVLPNLYLIFEKACIVLWALDWISAFHPQTDGQLECTIQITEDLLQSCVLSWKGSWDDHLPLVEFAYNNSYQASIKVAPYEALYGCRCISPLCWNVVGERSLVGSHWLQQTHVRYGRSVRTC